MFTWRVKQIMAEKNIIKPLRWMSAREMGRRHAEQVMQPKVKNFTGKDIAILCRYLKCTPNDLFTWHDGEDPIEPDHPLHQLVREKEAFPLPWLVTSLNVNQLEKIRAAIDEVLGKPGV